ncbi:MAG: tRNA threonylcarbamoyladenosine dehydratase, partial [Treponema sp.]|nr:tRNA threonylcarbamoyladenosine dehydratase [Treponema sp.]
MSEQFFKIDSESQFSRTELLLGREAVQKLQSASVLVFGCGGVGGFAIEALARAGVGKIKIVDNDVVNESNINRQIIALHSNIGRAKVDVMKERVKDINSSCEVITQKMFFLPSNSSEIDFSQFDYIVDAIDTVSAKIEIIKKAKEVNVPVISCMGVGNKIDATKIQVSDISKTHTCPLARCVRQALKNISVKNVKVVFSSEVPKIKTCDYPG